MIIKVCGMRDEQNIAQLKKLNPDFIGLIFYPKSSRFVGETPLSHLSESFAPAKKVGVMVNESEESILKKIADFKLDAVQLHGSESADLCKKLKSRGISVIKAFSIAGEEDIERIADYAGCVDFCLIDTKTPKVGGSGMKFDWNMLNNYPINTPFLLSGGIGPDDAELVKNLNFPAMVGVDLNSKFEISPAVKNIGQLQTFFQQIHQSEK